MSNEIIDLTRTCNTDASDGRMLIFVSHVRETGLKEPSKSGISTMQSYTCQLESTGDLGKKAETL
jgi:hypothetical protein